MFRKGKYKTVALSLAIILVLPFLTQLIHIHFHHGHRHVTHNSSHEDEVKAFVGFSDVSFDSEECPLCDYEFPAYQKSKIFRLKSAFVYVSCKRYLSKDLKITQTCFCRNATRGPPHIV